ncbi:MAG: valine--tRNA ligase, partial [Verrucomicrobia bacterium]|nr:valine--tRNA ligase [Verrucomicrobiota bacterium]
FTGIIRDKQGRKMSKTLGNSPDPLDLIARYGADALRFGTMRSAPLGQDVLFDEKDVELGRNFCNKLWNACRFRQMQGGEVQGEINAALLSSDDRWILLRLDQAIREVSDALASYNFATAVQSLYRFFWSEYCDWYVEASKAAFFGEDAALKANKVAVIDFVLSHLLRMFHPLLPFITEELWHGMGYSADMPEEQGGKTIMFARWPKPLSAEEKEAWGLDDTVETFANVKFELVTQGRNLKTQFNIGAGKKGKFTLKPAGNLAPGEAEVLRLLLSAESLDLDPNFAPKKGTPTALTKLGELYLPLDGLVDVEVERARLTKELAKIQAEIEKVEQKLANPSFAQKVPAAVLEEHKQRLADWQTKLAQTKAAIEALG